MSNIFTDAVSPLSACCSLLKRMDLSKYVVAVDFDGTCVIHEFPDVGRDVPGSVDVLKALSDAGARLILWTMRHDSADGENPYLKHAVTWFDQRQIPLYGANINHEQTSWSFSPKCYAHVYIDDAALGCPLVETATRPYVDWYAIAELLISRFEPGELELIHRTNRR
jgi:hypothetical protein